MPSLIPISAAKRISQECEYPIIIVFGIDPENGRQHVTTYGDTLANCEAAARGGNILKQHLGWPEQYCHAKTARTRRKEKLADA